MQDEEKSTPGMLGGIRVLDFGRIISGPVVGQIFGDLGAEVIKIERPPGGDETRSYSSGDKSGKSSLFWTLNRNKKSVALDLAKPEARDILHKLVETADVLVHNFRPGVMERLGLSAPEASQINPQLVYCSISGFGQEGPLRNKPANDVIIQAFGGLMSFLGDENGPYVRVAVPVADYTSGFYGAIAVLAALVERAQTGRGRLVETSLLEAMLAIEGMHIADYLKTRQLPKRLASGNLLGQPNQAFSTSDGAIVIATVNDPMWRRCAQALGGEALANDPRYATGRDRLERKDELAEVIDQLTKGMTTQQCSDQLDAVGVVCSPIYNLEQVTGNAQVRALDIIKRYPGHPDGPELVNSPIMVDGVRPAPRKGPPPLGGDTRDILAELGYSSAEIECFCATGAIATEG